MAVPKKKTSKERTNTRYANWKISAPTLTTCSECGEAVVPHRVCKNCGNYRGQKRIEVSND